MRREFDRLEMMIHTPKLIKLNNSNVIVFGVGGVGGYVVEALVRSSVGGITIVDDDVIKESNINRQIIATHSTIGQKKVEVFRNRIHDINPNCKVYIIDKFVSNQNIESFDLSKYDYVVDAIDSVEGKLAIIKKAQEQNVRVISCMGTGNKIDPTALRIDYIENSKICPLAKKMRRVGKRQGIQNFLVLYSIETPIVPDYFEENKKPSSCIFVPSVAGLMIANKVVCDITGFTGNGQNLS